MDTLRNENGFSVLLLCLMVLLVMTALGSAMLMTSQREIKSVNKLKLSTQAFYSAESGIQIAVAELNMIKAEDIDNFDFSIVDWRDELLYQLRQMQAPGYVPNQTDFVFDQSLYSLTGMRFETKVSFQGTGTDILCYGKRGDEYVFELGTLQEFYNAGKEVGRDFWPIYTITSIGQHGNNPNDLFKYAERNVQVKVMAEPSFVFPQAALTINGSLTNNGTPQSAIGDGHPLDANHCDVMDIVGTNDSINGYTGNTDICYDDDGNPYACHGTPDTQINAEPYPIEQAISLLMRMGTELTGDNIRNGVTIGDPDHPFDIYYYNGDIDSGLNNLSGYGILIVNGNLALGGNIDWDGMIFVTGDLTLNGGGSPDKYIHGSVLVGGDVTGNGNPDIYFNCDLMVDLWKATAAYHQKWWREIPGRHTLEEL